MRTQLVGASILCLLSAGCADRDVEDPIMLPDPGICGFAAEGDDPTEPYTFPPRDFTCPVGVEAPCAQTEPLWSEGQRTVDVPQGAASTHFYVLDLVRLPLPNVGSTYLAGFDVDGLDTEDGAVPDNATCEQQSADWSSMLEPEVEGVDNAYAALYAVLDSFTDDPRCEEDTAECLDRILADDIAAGDWLLGVEVAGVNSFRHDPEVEVTLYRVRTQDGRAPAATEDGRFTTGQTFVPVEVASETVRGDIFYGRLRVTWPTLNLPIERFGYPRDIARAELRASLCGSALTTGALGGVMPVSSMLDQFEAQFESNPEDLALAAMVLDTLADVDPSLDDPMSCEGMSFAYALDGVAGILNR